MDRVDTACIPRLAPHARLRWDEVRKQWVLLGPERVLELDEIGAAILQRCDGSLAVSELCEILAAEYEADYDTVEDDVRDFLTELAAKSLIRL